MTDEITGTARAKFFTGSAIETRKVKVAQDNSVLVYDNVAGHYTRCHTLSAASQRRIARQVRQSAA